MFIIVVWYYDLGEDLKFFFRLWKLCFIWKVVRDRLGNILIYDYDK